jgi:hypothetical protein
MPAQNTRGLRDWVSTVWGFWVAACFLGCGVLLAADRDWRGAAIFGGIGLVWVIGLVLLWNKRT